MIQLDRRSRDRLVWVAALIAPLAAVQIARQVGAPGPSSAAAARAPATAGAPDPTPPVVETQTRVLTDAQRLAAAWAGAHGPSADLRSPMDHADAAPEPEPQASPKARPASETPDPREPKAEFTLTSVMGGEGRSFAAINNRVFRMGEEPAPGWKITEIDVRERTVTITHADGRTQKLTAR